jgi:hypothetical protein
MEGKNNDVIDLIKAPMQCLDPKNELGYLDCKVVEKNPIPSYGQYEDVSIKHEVP